MKRKYAIWGIALLLLAGTIYTYSNHFNNDFHFDDTHTISNNLYIQNIKNIPLFFTDMNTNSSMPDNLGYRPITTMSTAIDYWLGGGLKPFYFHLSVFIIFVLQGILMFFMFFKIFNISYKHVWGVYIAFFATALFMLHPGNAETINYICQRADSFSTFFVILGLLLYMEPKVCRKFGIYLIAPVLGVLSKETATMFPLLLFVYILFFEKKMSAIDFFSFKKIKETLNAIKRTIPAFLVTFAAIMLVQLVSYYQSINSGFLYTTADSMGYHFKYLITQPYVLLTYFLQFIVPIGLSSDPDITVVESASDIRMWVGFLFIFLVVFLSFVASRSEKGRPIAFGLLWFLIASIPTSVLAALTQVSNSHRLFFPYVGLAIAISWAIYLFILKIQPVFKGSAYSRTIIIIAFIILAAYAYGTMQRNEVWRTEDSLWYDISQKNPENPRALMNYGLSRMSAGDYFEAEYYFRKSLKIWPNWTYLHINMGILQEAQGKAAEAEQWFLSAINSGANNPEPYYYYARSLNNKGQKQLAIANLQTAISISPAHMNSRFLLMGIYSEQGLWDLLRDLANSTLQISPNDANALKYLQMAEGKKSSIDMQAEEIAKNPTPEGYLTISMSYYQVGQYEKCIEACNSALKLNPNYAEAYNNICSAYNAMQKWDEGIKACEKALEIKSDFARARNNLNWAKTEKAKLVQNN